MDRKAWATSRRSEHQECSNCNLHSCFVLKYCKKSIDAISENKKHLLYEKESRLTGNAADGLYILSEGKLKVYKTDKHDDEIILNFIKPGEIFGILKNEEDEEYPFQIKALIDSSICFVDGNILRSITNGDASMAMALFKFHYEQSNRCHNRFFKIMQMHVPAKVAYALLTMFDAYGNDKEGNLDLKLSRLEIAGLATTTKEQVSKAMSEFKAAGIIQTKGKKISIVDFHKLNNLASV